MITNCMEWLKRWDNGQSVWSVEMGGLGPAYEQCIQIAMSEILRFMLTKKYNPVKWEDNDIWERDRDEIKKMGYKNPKIVSLQITGAQWGAALSLAACFFRKGISATMEDEQVKDRHIQISRTFPCECKL